ncbi:MAG TPA: hypothetical protein DCS93_29650 [Microscillaceae bacterium]|nr:hypothetical protein [Microscillaceae bacterium]
MQKQQIMIGWVGLSLLYHFIFWGEKMGLNVGLYQAVTTLMLVKLYPSAFRSKSVQVATLFTWVATFMIIWHNSAISKFAYTTSFVVMIGFVHQPRLNAVFYGLLHSMHALMITFIQGVQGVVALPKTSRLFNETTSRLALRRARLVAIPLVIFLAFFAIFQIANPVFHQMTTQGIQAFGQWLGQFSFYISPTWIFFMLMGLWVSAFALFNWRKDDVLLLEQVKRTQLIRKKRMPKDRLLDFHMVSLKNEYRAGIITFAMVNALLLVVNSIDINFLWINFDYGRAGNLTKLVHQGTYLLIFSILLAMGIILYFFRQNLNFYPQNRWLKRLAYVWIVQNAILVISVGLRTWYYIDATGLAYKRIGVLIYLGLTLFGLFTMYRKIDRRKTTFYLWKTNSWAVYTMMILMTFVNWDRLIVSYNFNYNQHTGEFVLTRSVRTLDLLNNYIQKIPPKERKAIIRTYALGGELLEISKENFIEERADEFLAEQNGYSWLSWNYGDWRTRWYLLAKEKRSMSSQN